MSEENQELASGENFTDEIMCPCSGTKRSYIKRLFDRGLDIEAISRASGALSGCGGCEWDIAGYIESLEHNKKSN